MKQGLRSLIAAVWDSGESDDSAKAENAGIACEFGDLAALPRYSIFKLQDPARLVLKIAGGGGVQLEAHGHRIQYLLRLLSGLQVNTRVR